VARRFVEPSKGVIDSTAALEGARAILIERFTEDATLVGTLREEVWSRGHLRSRVRAGKAEAGVKFTDYFEFSEPLAKLPSHRILALFRGEKDEVLSLELVPDPGSPDRGEPSVFERQIANRFKIADQGRSGDRWLIDTVRLAWRARILGHIESDLRVRLWQVAEDTAVRVFAGNLRDLLLAAPAGAHPTMGLDPGYRTGVKVAVVTRTGQVAATATIYPHEPQRRWDESIAQLARLAREHREKSREMFLESFEIIRCLWAEENSSTSRKSGSQETRRWRKADSNSESHPHITGPPRHRTTAACNQSRV
jgi:uncharacterized protein